MMLDGVLAFVVRHSRAIAFVMTLAICCFFALAGGPGGPPYWVLAVPLLAAFVSLVWPWFRFVAAAVLAVAGILGLGWTVIPAGILILPDSLRPDRPARKR